MTAIFTLLLSILCTLADHIYIIYRQQNRLVFPKVIPNSASQLRLSHSQREHLRKFRFQYSAKNMSITHGVPYADSSSSPAGAFVNTRGLEIVWTLSSDLAQGCHVHNPQCLNTPLCNLEVRAGLTALCHQERGLQHLSSSGGITVLDLPKTLVTELVFSKWCVCASLRMLDLNKALELKGQGHWGACCYGTDLDSSHNSYC